MRGLVLVSLYVATPLWLCLNFKILCNFNLCYFILEILCKWSSHSIRFWKMSYYNSIRWNPIIVIMFHMRKEIFSSEFSMHVGGAILHTVSRNVGLKQLRQNHPAVSNIICRQAECNYLAVSCFLCKQDAGKWQDTTEESLSTFELYHAPQSERTQLNSHLIGIDLKWSPNTSVINNCKLNGSLYSYLWYSLCFSFPFF